MSAEYSPDASQRPDTARLFFALWPPDALAGSLVDVAQDLARQWGGRATRRETVHLTLEFLGDVAVSEIPKLCTAGDSIHALPFSLTIDRCGYWQHNRLFWAGPGEIPERLHNLHRQLRTALAESACPVGRYIPHITLVRRVASPSAPSLLRDKAFRALDWPCTSFVLVRSVPTAGGSAYQVLREFPLR